MSVASVPSTNIKWQLLCCIDCGLQEKTWQTFPPYSIYCTPQPAVVLWGKPTLHVPSIYGRAVDFLVSRIEVASLLIEMIEPGPWKKTYFGECTSLLFCSSKGNDGAQSISVLWSLKKSICGLVFQRETQTFYQCGIFSEA